MTRLTILAPPPRWLALIATAGVVIVATAVVVALLSNRDAGTASAQPSAVPAAAVAVADPASAADSPGTAPSAEAVPAREYLRAMTTAVAATATDTQTGSYAYVHVKMWAADDTLRPRGGSTTYNRDDGNRVRCAALQRSNLRVGGTGPFGEGHDEFTWDHHVRQVAAHALTRIQHTTG